MIVPSLLLVGFAVGHFCIFISLVNWTHGIGFMIRRHDLIIGPVLIALGLASLGGFAWLARTPWRGWPWPVRLYLGICLAVACVGLPLVTVLRARRRLPAEVEGRETVLDLTRPQGAAALIGPSWRRWIFQIPGNHSFRLLRDDWILNWPGLPPALDGLSLLHISDLHFSRVFDERFFHRVLAEAAALPSDLVCFTGDLVDEDECRDWIVPVLGPLRGRLGTFAILGNHDLLYAPEALASALGKAGFTVLDAGWERLACAGRNPCPGRNAGALGASA